MGWGKFFLALGFGGAAWALSDDADADAGTGTPDYSVDAQGGRWDHLFEAFWWTAGREESRNRLNDWRNVRDRWASIGWMHFSQSHSITSLMETAMNDDWSKFVQAFGSQAANFSNLGWVRTANLNGEPYKSLLVAWLGSSWGEEIQRRVAADHYFVPTMAMMDRVRPDADDVYRVVAASTRIVKGMDEVEAMVQSSPTVEAFTQGFEQKYSHVDLRYRFPRQLANARSMLTNGYLANT